MTCPPLAQRGELDAAKRALIDYPLSRFSDFFLSDLASHWKNRHPTEKIGRKEGWMDEGKRRRRRRRRRNYFKFSLRMWKNCALKGELFAIQFNADKAPTIREKLFGLSPGVKRVEKRLVNSLLDLYS